jgi:hypothetical protein
MTAAEVFLEQSGGIFRTDPMPVVPGYERENRAHVPCLRRAAGYP